MALLLALAPLAASAINIAGTSAGVSWSAATGPVTGYAVQVSRNGSAYVEEARVTGTSTRVAGQIGDTLRIRVAAYDATGRMGAASVASDALTFTQTAPPPPPPPPPGGGDPAGDVDGDGMSDALAFNAKTGEVSVLLLHSDGSRTWQSIGTPTSPGMRPVGYADVNADGQGDLLWRSSASGDNELWLMNGSNYTTVALPNKAASFRVAALRDFSGDGRADAMFYDPSAGASEVWTLNGAGRTGVSPVDAAPTGMMLAAVADVDGDGSPDLVWHDRSSDALEGWRMIGANPAAIFTLPNAPENGSVAGAGDVDGDGADDLVWYVATKGDRSVDVWFMDGMNAPVQGIALHVTKKSRLRGVTDVDGDGRADLVLARKSGFTAVSVDPTGTQNASGDTEWTTQPIDLDEVPASKRWYFLVLE